MKGNEREAVMRVVAEWREAAAIRRANGMSVSCNTAGARQFGYADALTSCADWLHSYIDRLASIPGEREVVAWRCVSHGGSVRIIAADDPKWHRSEAEACGVQVTPLYPAPAVAAPVVTEAERARDQWDRALFGAMLRACSELSELASYGVDSISSELVREILERALKESDNA